MMVNFGGGTECHDCLYCWYCVYCVCCGYCRGCCYCEGVAWGRDLVRLEGLL